MEQYYLPGEHPSILNTFHVLFRSMDERTILKEIGAFLDTTQAPIDLRDEQASTLLHWACSRGHEQVVLMLLKRKADPNLAAWQGKTPMHSTMGHEGSTRILDMLLKYGADMEARDGQGRTPMHHAISQAAMLGSRSISQVSHMIALGANMLAPDMGGTTPAALMLSYSFLDDGLKGLASGIVQSAELQEKTTPSPDAPSRPRF